MNAFPKSLETPSSVDEARAKRFKDIFFATTLGLGIRLSLVIFQLFGAFYFDSATLQTDAFSTLADVVSTVFLLVCIRLAYRPPDASHPLGHGRFEPLGGMQLGLLLILLGGALGIQQIAFLFHTPHPKTFQVEILIFPILSVVLLELSYRVAARVAYAWKSPALIADAYHYRIDAVTSIFAALALVVAYAWPSSAAWVDRIGAIGVSLLMILLGFFSSKENLHQLVDHKPDPEVFKTVRRSAERVNGVLGTEKLYIQSYGPDAFVSIDVEVDPTLAVDKAHRISQLVRLEVQKDWPNVREVIVHLEPFYPEDHTVIQ